MATLVGVGEFTHGTLEVLSAQCIRANLPIGGNIRNKTYEVFSRQEQPQPFSRPVNASLFIFDAAKFRAAWGQLLEALTSARQAGRMTLEGFDAHELDRICYTASLAYAAAADVFWKGDRGSPGTAFEVTVGALVSHLAGRQEHGAVDISVPGAPYRETINVDVTIGDEADPPVLAMPTKLTTRERIVQPYVHQHILDSARPGLYRGLLCICSENNVMAPKGLPADKRAPDVCWVQDTLVPGTIALYERYMAHLDLYYLDPPESYLSGAHAALAPVRRFSSLLLGDLADLLERGPK